MRKKIIFVVVIVCVIFLLSGIIFFSVLFPRKYKNYVDEATNEYNIDKSLVYAIIKAESNFDKNAVSVSGAMGLMQLMPATAYWIANELDLDFVEDDLFDPEINIKFGCFYLYYLFDKFGNINTVIAAYNAGETKVLQWLDESGQLDENKIDYAETKNYLIRVKRYMKIYKLIG